ncbi:DUF2203 domain-containing protein [Paludifilum halophilum]|uniref:Cell division protein DivIVA n=1 Tax=Paludifilum halophilum TaxID=1642702 RepID=A0A235B591_9BACL|nr:DUF2203 domain-containing protein [Paludifilum halophilum]OYD07476.1 hypothetical protein CHM34_11285 [Paludifilum halophilum]
MDQKPFTVEEVNRLLPQLRDQVYELRCLKKEFEFKFGELQQKKTRAESGDSAKEDPYFKLEAQLEFLNIQMRSGIEAIRKTGALLKDIDWGLIDFPSRRQERDVLLCWKVDEPRVSHWHYLWEDYFCRKGLEEEKGSCEN